jgi:predicted metal-dependent phosphoesterase TrpH
VFVLSFKTEMHCHSATVSNCASITPEEIVEKYLACGYTTVVLADHLSPYTFQKRYKGSEDWQERIDYYMEGYHALKRAAAGRLHVLQGCELRIKDAPSDFLVYGITEEFMRATPDLLEPKPVKEMCTQLREAGFLVYQAHPFRNAMSITKPAYLDGIEVYNAHPWHDSRNDFAALWAKRFHLGEISGSDVHDAPDTAGGGILTDTPITSMPQLLETLRAGTYTLLREGNPGDGIRQKPKTQAQK